MDFSLSGILQRHSRRLSTQSKKLDHLIDALSLEAKNLQNSDVVGDGPSPKVSTVTNPLDYIRPIDTTSSSGQFFHSQLKPKLSNCYSRLVVPRRPTINQFQRSSEIPARFRRSGVHDQDIM